MSNDALELAASRFALRLIGSEDLARVAVQCLELGFDAPSLRILAGLTEGEADEAKRVFEEVLKEFGVPMPNVRAAVKRLAREAAKEIVSGKVDAYVGAKRIWDLTLSAPHERWPDLDPFIYAASEWEERPEDREFFEKEVLAEAKRQVN